MRRCFALVVLFVLAVSSSFAQEKSVKPGINTRWEKPDMAEAVVLLEQEFPDIYKRRHAIVSTLAPESGLDFADLGAGTGFIARLLASEVGSEGKVYAVDISQESLCPRANGNSSIGKESFGLSFNQALTGDALQGGYNAYLTVF